MRKSGALILVALWFSCLTVASSFVWAQSSKRLHYSTMFNPQTVGTVSGEVVRLEQVLSGNGADYCVHALLKTPKGQVTVILAPKSYMEEKGLTLAPGDRVEVTGSFISILGKPYILAQEVRGDRHMTLRAADGRPAWAVGQDWHVRPTSKK